MPKEGQTSTSRANRRALALPIVFYQENPYAAQVALVPAIAGENHCLPKRFTCPLK